MSTATRRLLLCVCLAAGLATGSGAQSETYRWVDEHGRVNYSDRPPPPGVRQVEEKRFASEPADTVDSYTVRRAAADFPLVLYTSDNCGDPCTLARDLLNRRGAPYTETKIATQADLAAFRERVGMPDTVPTLIVGSRPLRSFEAGAWNRALDEAGYPAAAAPKY